MIPDFIVQQLKQICIRMLPNGIAQKHLIEYRNNMLTQPTIDLAALAPIQHVNQFRKKVDRSFSSQILESKIKIIMTIKSRFLILYSVDKTRQGFISIPNKMLKYNIFKTYFCARRQSLQLFRLYKCPMLGLMIQFLLAGQKLQSAFCTAMNSFFLFTNNIRNNIRNNFYCHKFWDLKLLLILIVK